ncbi:MAG TPA: efflux RND transporter periplasmic adaptor subunit [Arenimonas sp.]|nr:efflux RND transporter periplasmic adaptor subunit [Arenimonas sp.]
MKHRKLAIGGAIVTLVVIVAAIGMSRGRGDAGTTVEVTSVKRAEIVQKVNGTGKIQPNIEINISADVSAKITRLDVKEGDRVEKGQLLVELDGEKYLASVQSQEANVRSARANARLASENRDQAQRVLKRAEEMRTRKLISQSELDAAKTAFQVESSRHQSALDQVEQSIGFLKQAQDDLSKTSIYAPISGTISDLNKEVGEIAIGSQFQEDVIMVVAQLGAMEALINVDENDINAIAIGQPAEISVDAVLGEKITGSVSEIASSATPVQPGATVQKTEFEVKVAITSDTRNLRPGMTASADIVTQTRDDALSVPIQSVTVRTADQLKVGEDKDTEFKAGDDGFVEVVFVVTNGKARARPVKAGIQSDELIEITDGLKEGEQVVSGSYRAISRDLGNGEAVTISQAGADKEGDGKDGR